MASPPPLPQQPPPACFFLSQDDELQTLATQMLRSPSTPMASPPPPPQQPAPGCSFFPQDHELVMHYLRPKLDESPLPAATKHFFYDADVYAAEPSTLTSPYTPGPARTFGESNNWYFFCPVRPTIASNGRKSRTVAGGKGTWKAERGNNVVDPVKGGVVGRLERFTYVPKPKEEGKPPEWLMVEFSVNQEEGGGEPRMLLYKIYRSPRFLKNASKSSSSSASVRKRKAADVQLDLSPLSVSARKTKAAKESSRVRRQLLFPSPPAPNLTAEVDQLMAQYLSDDRNWEGYNCVGNPSAPWSSSTMTPVVSTPFCSGLALWNSVAVP